MKKQILFSLLFILWPLITQTMNLKPSNILEEGNESGEYSEFSGIAFLSACLDKESNALPGPDSPRYIAKIEKQFNKLKDLETKRLDELKKQEIADSNWTSLLSGVPDYVDCSSTNNIEFADPKWPNLLKQACCYEDCSPMIEEMLKKDVPTDEPDIFGALPLYHACLFGCVKNVSLLLKHNADPNLRSCSDTSLMAAIEGGNLKIIMLLLGHKDIEVNTQRPHQGTTALMHAVEHHEKLDKACADDQDLRKNIITALIDAGADISIEDTNNQTAMDIARGNGFVEFAELMENYPAKTRN